jgi:hypothetical protein
MLETKVTSDPAEIPRTRDEPFSNKAFTVLILICLAFAIVIFKADRAPSRETKSKRPHDESSAPGEVIRKDVVSAKDGSEAL